MSEVKQFTYEELNAHKSRDSLWLTIHKKVYDVTPFLDEVSCCNASEDADRAACLSVMGSSELVGGLEGR